MVRMLSASSVPPHHSPPIGHVPSPTTETPTPLFPRTRCSICDVLLFSRYLAHAAGSARRSIRPCLILHTTQRQARDQVSLGDEYKEQRGDEHDHARGRHGAPVHPI